MTIKNRLGRPRARLDNSSPRALAWLTVGLGVKRYVLLALSGLVLTIFGTALSLAYVAINLSLLVISWVDALTGHLPDSIALGFTCLTLGVTAVIVGVRGVYKAVERAYDTDFLETALKRRRLEAGERIVALGGGTGLSTMLRGLKHGSSNITAIVTMADDGGSSGLLREHGLLPPGDLRNCIAALAEAEPLMTRLFQHRFEGLGELKGHSLGNLIVAAMFEMTGDFDQAVRETSKVLAIRGRVLPSTIEDIQLCAELEDGTQIEGQVNVNAASGIARAFLRPDAPAALPGAVRAIETAQAIVIGPGSLYTSIIPNLLVPEIASAIKASIAPKIYVCNVMTQPNETLGYSASDHVRAITRHIGSGVITHVLINSAPVPAFILDRYATTGAAPVVVDEAELELLGMHPVTGDFVDISPLDGAPPEPDPTSMKNVVRHHPDRLATAIYRILTGRL